MSDLLAEMDAIRNGATTPSSANGKATPDPFIAEADAIRSGVTQQATASPAPNKSDNSSYWDDIGRQFGLTVRHGITGVTGIPAMIGDALNAGTNAVLGTHLQPLSTSIQNIENSAGLPQPKNAQERVVGDVTSAMAGMSPTYSAGKLLSQSVLPAVKGVGQTLAAAPGMQIAGAAGSGAGSGIARENGYGTTGQLIAGIGGGGLGVLGASGATSAVKSLNQKLADYLAQPMDSSTAAIKANQGVNNTIAELGPQASQSFNTSNLDDLKDRIAKQIQLNPNVDPATAMRAADFKSLGIDPTLGQITRDPAQFAQELNMRGVPNVGNPLQNRLAIQNRQLQQALYGLAGAPQETQVAGKTISDSLSNIDNGLRSAVSDAYKTAQQSSGKTLNVPLQGIAQDYAQVLNDFGDKVPSGVRNNFDALGLQSGTQQKVFDFEKAEKLLQVINANKSNDPSTNTALGQLSKSVKNAILSADDQGGVFANARQLAAQRFSLHDQIPALEAASKGTINSDDFVRKFIVNGKTDETSALANLLKQNDPQAFNEVKSQLGASLGQAAFGNNITGDAKFAPDRLATALRQMGSQKIGAFFKPDEANDLNTIGRVGAYINSIPTGSPVNTSNSASALTSLVGAGVKKLPYVGGMVENAQNKAFVNKALAAALRDAPKPDRSFPVPSAGDAVFFNSLRTPATNK